MYRIGVQITLGSGGGLQPVLAPGDYAFVVTTKAHVLAVSVDGQVFGNAAGVASDASAFLQNDPAFLPAVAALGLARALTARSGALTLN